MQPTSRSLGFLLALTVVPAFVACQGSDTSSDSSTADGLTTNPCGTPPTCADQPDLVVSAVTLSTASPAAGAPVTFSALVTNVGGVATPAGIVIGVAFSVDGAGVSWSDTNSTALAPGASVKLTANSGPTGSATYTAVAGAHTVTAFVNDINRFGECSATNNTATASFTVGGGTPPPPPPPPPPAKSSIFYGVNGHWVQGGPYASVPASTQKATLQDIGVSTFRQDLYNLAGAQTVATKAAAIAPIKVIPAIILSAVGTTEQDAYDSAYSRAAAIGNVLKGKVPYYEIGNEYDNVCITGGDGNSPSQYDNTCFIKYRGVIRGTIDGLKSVDAATPIIGGSSAGWLHFGWTDMLWNGTQPDGSSGHPQVRWDATVYHWYSDMADITHACGGSGCYNLLEVLKTHYGKPIFITEFGVRPKSFSSEAAMGTYMTNTLVPMFVNRAAAYDIIGVIFYQLYSDAEGSYGLFDSDGTTKTAKYGAYKSYIGAHPM